VFLVNSSFLLSFSLSAVQMQMVKNSESGILILILTMLLFSLFSPLFRRHGCCCTEGVKRGFLGLFAFSFPLPLSLFSPFGFDHDDQLEE